MIVDLLFYRTALGRNLGLCCVQVVESPRDIQIVPRYILNKKSTLVYHSY
jgi:hypothetical protein